MNDQPEETFEIGIQLGNSLTQYLGNRPYVEVAGLIQQLQAAANYSAFKKNNPVAAQPDKPADEGSEPNEQ